MATAVERANQPDVATEASGPEEKAQAQELLKRLTSTTSWTKDDVVKSLTIPRGEEYLESTLIRFLRARKGDIAKSSEMMSEALEFRKQHDVDNILEKPIAKELLRHIRKGIYDGFLPSFDTFGRPIYVLRGGASNDALHSLLKENPTGYADDWDIHLLEDAFVHWHLIMIEYLTTVLFAEATKKAGRLINKYIVIDDLKGLTLHGIKGLYKIISCFKKTTVIDQLLYPELLGMLMFCNSPSVFRAPYKLISSFLEGDTTRKIFVLGGESQFRPALDVVAKREQLPEFFGGTLKGHHVSTYESPDTVMYDRIDDFVAENGKRVGFDIEKRSTAFTKIHLPAKAEESVAVKVNEGEVVEWQLTVEAHDVSYRAVFQPDKDGAASQVVDEPARNPHASDIRWHNSYHAEQPGTLTIWVSNKHSRMRSKTVLYRIYTWQPQAKPEDNAEKAAQVVEGETVPTEATPASTAQAASAAPATAVPATAEGASTDSTVPAKIAETNGTPQPPVAPTTEE